MPAPATVAQQFRSCTAQSPGDTFISMEKSTGAVVTEEDPVLLERMLELEEIALAERDRRTREALNKFNFFLHITAFLSVSAYMIILAVLMPKTSPFVFIPVVVWAVCLGYHARRAWRPLPGVGEALAGVKKSLEKPVENETGQGRRG